MGMLLFEEPIRQRSIAAWIGDTYHIKYTTPSTVCFTIIPIDELSLEMVVIA